MNIFEKLKSFFQIPSSSRTLALIGILIVLVALPVTVIFLGQTTNIFQHAAMINVGGGGGSSSCPTSTSSGCQPNTTQWCTITQANCSTYYTSCANDSRCGYSTPTTLQHGDSCGPNSSGTCLATHECDPSSNTLSLGANCGQGLTCCIPKAPTPPPSTTTPLCEQNGGACEPSGQCRAEISIGEASLLSGANYSCPTGLVCCGNPKVTPLPVSCNDTVVKNAYPNATCLPSATSAATNGCDLLPSGQSDSTIQRASCTNNQFCCLKPQPKCTCKVEGGSSVNGEGNYSCSDNSSGACDNNAICTSTLIPFGKPCKRIDSLKETDLMSNTGTYAPYTLLGNVLIGLNNKDLGYCFDSSGTAGVCMFTSNDNSYTPLFSKRCATIGGWGCTDINSAYRCVDMTSKYYGQGSHAFSIDTTTGGKINVCANFGHAAPDNVVKCCILDSSAITSPSPTPTPTPISCQTPDGSQKGACIFSQNSSSQHWTTTTSNMCKGPGNICPDFTCQDAGYDHDIPANIGINSLNPVDWIQQQCGFPGGVGARVRCCAPKSTGGPGGGPSGPACIPGQQTSFALDIKLDGIGPGTFENNNPAHPNRNASIVVKDDSGNTLFGQSRDFSHQINEDKGKGRFASAGGNIQAVCGKKYTLTVKVPGYLPAPAEVVYGQTNQVIQVEPIPGDINIVDATTGIVVGDDKINNLDYQIFAQCHVNQDPDYTLHFANPNSTTGPSIDKKCRDLINLLDYQDGGTQDQPNSATGVDEFAANYNLWLRGFLKANGQ